MKIIISCMLTGMLFLTSCDNSGNFYGDYVNQEDEVLKLEDNGLFYRVRKKGTEEQGKWEIQGNKITLHFNENIQNGKTYEGDFGTTEEGSYYFAIGDVKFIKRADDVEDGGLSDKETKKANGDKFVGLWKSVERLVDYNNAVRYVYVAIIKNEENYFLQQCQWSETTNRHYACDVSDHYNLQKASENKLAGKNASNQSTTIVYNTGTKSISVSGTVLDNPEFKWVGDINASSLNCNKLSEFIQSLDGIQNHSTTETGNQPAGYFKQKSNNEVLIGLGDELLGIRNGKTIKIHYCPTKLCEEPVKAL